jgi:hypothetical protein
MCDLLRYWELNHLADKITYKNAKEWNEAYNNAKEWNEAYFDEYRKLRIKLNKHSMFNVLPV